MTPCEKLGYKVGDKFEMLRSTLGFKKCQVVTLFEDDGSESPCFKGDNSGWNNAGGEPGAYIGLSDVKPLSQRADKPISKSKRQLAQLLIEAGVTQFPEGANWAAQDKAWGGHVNSVLFYRGDSKPCMTKGDNSWTPRADDCWLMYNIQPVQLPTLIPNWHQTVLSRDEFDQIVAETVVTSEHDGDGWIEWCGKPESPVDEGTLVDVKMKNGTHHEAQLLSDACWSDIWGDAAITHYRLHKSEHVEPTVTPTLDQLLQDWRNADDYAQRKQAEADEAAAMRDERWQAAQARAGEMGVTVVVSNR